jgi:hypothetical protein
LSFTGWPTAMFGLVAAALDAARLLAAEALS